MKKDVAYYEKFHVHRHLYTHEKLIKVFDEYVKTLPPKKLAKIATLSHLASMIPGCTTPEKLATCKHNCAKSGHRETLARDIGRVDEVAGILMQSYFDSFYAWIEGEKQGGWRWDVIGHFFCKVCLNCGGPNRSDMRRCRECDPDGWRRDDEAMAELSGALATDQSIHRLAAWEKRMRFDKENCIAALDWLYPPGAVVEIRVPEARQLRVLSGYFSERENLLDALEAVSGDYPAIYVTLNPVDPQLLGRVNNELKGYAKNLTIDKEIPRRINFLIDADPIRPTGISSTDEQFAESRKMIAAVRRGLAAAGWPQPLIAASGNGHHAIYAIDLPNDDDCRDLLHRCLEKLSAEHSTETCKVDCAVFNASRIVKCYGTFVMKGANLPTRPHRMALVYAPPGRVVVARELLEALGGVKPPSPGGGNWKDRIAAAPKAGSWTKESVDEHVRKGFENPGKPMEYQGGWKWQHGCPFDENHRAPDAYTLWTPGDDPHCHCSHDSCREHAQREWREKWGEASGEKWPQRRYWQDTALMKFADEAP